jgi:diketogulonate reductase-like aldo/keto reductase
MGTGAAASRVAGTTTLKAAHMNPLTDQFTLSNGLAIPALGFGTWQIPDGKPAYESVLAALNAGYRHIDTARAYGNEASVGRAITDSGIDPGEVFVTTKLPAEVKDAAGARDAFEKSITALGVDAVDLYLIHAPWPWSEIGADYAAGNAEVWQVMAELYEAGRTRSIGVSNFVVSDLEKLVDATGVVPMANQIRYFVGHTQDEVTRYCQDKGILVEGYSPLATGSLLDNSDLDTVAARYGRSVPQLCIRYVFQKGVLPLPKSVTPARIVDNTDLDFEISADDMAYLDGLTDTAE